MELTLEQAEILLLMAAIVAMLVRRLHIPYSVGLVIAGVGLALLQIIPSIRLTKELIFGIFLPPLVFQAALDIRWCDLRRDSPVILTLATLGVLLSAGLTAVGMHLFAQWEWVSAILFGALIAATDPVSVIATLKETGIHGRLRLLLEAESLFNDGTAAVAFTVALTLATGSAITGFGVAQTLVVTVIGGILCGGIVSGGALLLAGQTEDHLVEMTFTTIAAYGSFLLAEYFHVSGILAALTAGLVVGNMGPLGSISDKGRDAVESFWEYVAFVVNSLIFILIGIYGTHQEFASALIAAVIAIFLVLLGRAIAVYPCCALFARSALRVEQRHQHILFWGGLRGALALALALGLPPQVPRYEEIITVTFAVVTFSIIVQGVTMIPLLNWMGVVPKKQNQNAADTSR
jgi:monovalent cation:H+ antiporter, CPA1 family